MLSRHVRRRRDVERGGATDRRRAVSRANRRVTRSARPAGDVDQRARRGKMRVDRAVRFGGGRARERREWGRVQGQGAVRRRLRGRRVAAAGERHLREHEHKGTGDGARRGTFGCDAREVRGSEVRGEGAEEIARGRTRTHCDDGAQADGDAERETCGNGVRVREGGD